MICDNICYLKVSVVSPGMYSLVPQTLTADMSSHRSKLAKCLQVIFDIFIYVAATGLLFIFFVFVTPSQQGFFCDDATIKKPRLKDTVSALYLLIGGVAVPIICIVVFELLMKVVHSRLKSGRPIQFAVSVCKLVGMFLYGLAITMLITEGIKVTVGRLRPHFIDSCKPNATLMNCTHGNEYITDVECTADLKFYEAYDIRKSFPSGHASMSLYSAIFLIIYLESRFIVRWSMFLKSAVQVALLLGGLYTAATRVTDNRHHLDDVIAGCALGGVCAVWAHYVLSQHMRFQSILTKGEGGGDPTTAAYKEPMPCHHHHDRNGIELGLVNENGPVPKTSPPGKVK